MEQNRRYHFKREDSNSSNSGYDFYSQNERKPMRKLVTPTSSLEIVEGDGFDGASGYLYERSPSDASLRPWSRASVGFVPPGCDSSASRRTITPTKQVSLQAVKRREESSEPFVDHVDVGNVRLEGSVRKAWEFSDGDDDIDFSNLSLGDSRLNHPSKTHLVNGAPLPSSSLSNGDVQEKLITNKREENKTKITLAVKKDKDSSSSEDDDDDDDRDEKKKAPNELLMEFVDCLMKKDFPNASKLCHMILLYEPENEEALKFKPLIEEKMQLDIEAAAEGSSDEDDDDDDDDSDSDSSSDDDDDDSSEEDDDDNEDGRKGSQQPTQPQEAWGKSTDRNTSRVWKPAS